MKLQTNLLLMCILALSAVIQGYSAGSIPAGQVLYLPFDGDVVDQSGNNYTVTNNGATLAPDRFGNENSAYYFNNNDYMTIPIEQNLPNVTEAGYTVSFWIKQDITASDGGYMMSYGYWNTYGGFNFRYSAGTSETENYSIGINENPSGSTNMYFNRYNIFAHGWNMISFTYQNGRFRGYVNGCFVEELAAEAYNNPSVDFVIGNRHDYSDGVTAWIDDVVIYDRALSDVEVAQVSGLDGAIRAAELSAYTLADFELGELEPVKLGNGWNIFGNTGSSVPDLLSYIRVEENPLKTDDNNTDYVGVAVTFPTNVTDLFNYTSRKMEYYIDTKDDEMNDRHHIMQWKAMYPDSALVKVDSINWFTQNQIHGNFQMFAPPCYGTGQIAGGSGGIFNENSLETHTYTSKDDRLNFRFFYRAMPDSSSAFYTMDIGKWVTFTYDIYWSADPDKGYWRMYKDGELISYADSVKTLPDCAPVDNLQWKTGTYCRWNDDVSNLVDSIAFYFDELELYVDPEDDGITIADINPDAYASLQDFLEYSDKCDAISWTTSANITDATSYGGSDGAIDLTASVNSQIASYSWSSGANTQDVNNLNAGNYTVTITDTMGCTTTPRFTVGQPPFDVPYIASVSASSSDGNGPNNMLDNDASTRWSTPVMGATATFVLDSEMFIDSVGIYPNSGDARITYFGLSSSLDNISWSPEIRYETSGSYAGYEYFNLDANARYVRLTGYANSQSGYTSIQEFRVFTGVDNGCSSLNWVSSASITDVTAYAGTDGAIDFSVSGSQVVSYLWNNGATTQDIDNLLAGTYSVTVTDTGSCTTTASYTVNQPAYDVPYIASVSASDDDGNVAANMIDNNPATRWSTDLIDGSAYATFLLDSLMFVDSVAVHPNAGNIRTTSFGLSYSRDGVAWSNISPQITSGTLDGYEYFKMGANARYIRVTGYGNSINNWTSILEFRVYAGRVNESCEEVTINLSAGVTNETDGQDNGIIDVTTSGGTTPYTWLWNDGATAEDRTGLSAATYSVTATDIDGCTGTANWTLSNVVVSDPCEGTTISVTGITYNETDNLSNGEIDVTTSGGTAPYSWVWNDAVISEDRNSLSASTYSVTATDAEGCVGNSSWTISNVIHSFDEMSVAGLVTHEQNENGLGAVDITVSGGQEPYVYLWSNGQTSQNLSGLTQGSYTITVTDASDDVVVETFAVENEVNCSILDINYSADETLSVLQFTGENSGSIVHDSIIGGEAPYTYLWNDGEITVDRHVLDSGYYSVQITDANGCTGSSSFYIERRRVSGIEENQAVDVIGCVVYPNPSDGYFNLKFDNDLGETEVSVYSASGIKEFEQQTTIYEGADIRIDLNSLNAGVYYLRIKSDHVQDYRTIFKY